MKTMDSPVVEQIKPAARFGEIDPLLHRTDRSQVLIEFLLIRPPEPALERPRVS